MIKIIVLCGPAGSGKDTIMQKVLELFPDRYHEIVSCTTRPPREGEVDGKNYHFLTKDEFTKRLLSGDLLEATEFNGWHYGTLKSDLREDQINIGVFNPEGVLSLMESFGSDQLSIIEVVVSPKTRLLRQLNREQDPDVDEIIRRYSTDKEDFADFHSALDEMHAHIYAVQNEEVGDIEEIAKAIGQL